MKIVNLIGFALTVGGVVIPSDGRRAIHNGFKNSSALSVQFDDLGSIPVASPPVVGDLTDCSVDGEPFPEPQDGVVYLAAFPVRLAALASDRSDVWGMGDRVDPQDPSKGVKNLVS